MSPCPMRCRFKRGQVRRTMSTRRLQGICQRGTEANLSGEGRPSSGQRVVHHQRGLHGVSRCRIAISTVWRGPSSRCWRGLEGRQSLHHLHHAPLPPPVALAGPVAHRKQLEVHSAVAQSSRDAKKSQLSSKPPAKQTNSSSRPLTRARFRQGQSGFWMLNFRSKIISTVSQSVRFFAVPPRSPHRDEHIR